MTITFGSKGDTLARLAPLVTRAKILPQVTFTVGSWRRDAMAILRQIAGESWGQGRMIVRSSASAEDRDGQSMAGHFLSLLDIQPAALADAIEQVIGSFTGADDPHDQVLVQPFLTGVDISGVAFSRDPATGAHYLIINYDETGDVTAVTGGQTDQLKMFVHFRGAEMTAPAPLDRILNLMEELERLLGSDALDVEFAMAQGELYLFQCRPLRLPDLPTLTVDQHKGLLSSLVEKVRRASGAHPYLHGRRTIYGIMPDWNPAEIIGVRPRPLALSLYRRLVTDSIWAYQRHNYGYRNLRSFPLMLSFHGQPYIDVRVSFNSFIPSDVDAGLAARLVDHYVEKLAEKPSLHDKVEFEIVLSCYSLDLPERLENLRQAGFTADECDHLADCLRRLTNRIVHPKHGLWVQDLAKVEQLDERRRAMQDGNLDRAARIYWLLEDCKRYGTLPFAGLARAAFVAVQMLKSLVTVGALRPDQYHSFMNELDTVTRRMGRDLGRLGRSAFLERYGHLRPGTYDILSPRYDEEPDRYFDWESLATEEAEPAPAGVGFALTLDQMRSIADLLERHRLDMDVVGLFDFIRSSIQGRELAKFNFSRSLSDALSLLHELGAAHGFSRDDMSYADIDVIERLYVECADPVELLGRAIASGRERHGVTCQMVLPPLVENPDQIWSFHMPPTEPNFVTRNQAEGHVEILEGVEGGRSLEGAIVVLPNADPGFDWIFTKNIAGFITAYGGANSHMAIRAGELDLPAIIGAGRSRYDIWRQASRLRIDCANRQVQVLR